MTKLKLTMTWVYDADPAHYEGATTPEEMARIDEAQGPQMAVDALMNSPDVDVKVRPHNDSIVSVDFEVSPEQRRAVNAWYGEEGLADDDAIRRFIKDGVHTDFGDVLYDYEANNPNESK